MRILSGLALAGAVIGAPASQLDAQAWGPRVSDVRARVWIEDERDYFRRGERMRVRFSTSADAYVAIIHIDTDGRLEFLYPSAPRDRGVARGGRAYTLPTNGSWTMRGSPGIGYIYLIAAGDPLDYSHFGGPYGSGWDWSFAGRSVHGDPFWALEQVTRTLIPDWRRGNYVVDYYSYQVEGRHSYPAYACSVGDPRAWGWGSGYGSCDRLVVFLRQNPGYYDAGYPGDRRAYYPGADDDEPRHGFKAPADARGFGTVRAPAAAAPAATPVARNRPTTAPPARGIPSPRANPPRAEPQPRERPAPRAREPQRTPERPARRPVLERRGRVDTLSVRGVIPTSPT
jgi:hypothetical protein